MLEYLRTSIFDSPAQTLVNTVNTVGVMGKGIAAEFKQRYPDMFLRYREFCENGHLDIGKLYIYRTPNKWILNFPTKKHWRNPSKLEYIESGLTKFVETYTASGITSISFPQLGCGNGDLPWEEVCPLMERYLKRLPIPVYIHIVSRRADFVPEHRKFELSNRSQEARQDIGFGQFLYDLSTRFGDEILQYSNEDLEDLWNSLRLRGALRRDNFPGGLRERSAQVMQLLLRLDYIEPTQFLETNSSGRLVRIPGVQLMLPPIQDGVAVTTLEI